MDDLLDHIAVMKATREIGYDIHFIQLPLEDWHKLRQYMLDEYDIVRHKCYCGVKREHFIFQGMAMFAGSHWGAGGLE